MRMPLYSLPDPKYENLISKGEQMTQNEPMDLNFYKVKRKPSQKQIEANRRNGKLGGLKKVPKGFAALDKEKAKEIQSKGGLAQGGNIQAYNEKRKKL